MTPAGHYGATQQEYKMQVRKADSGSPKNVFMLSGVTLLLILCLAPIWNAIGLLTDYNYTYWVGSSVPLWMLFLCVASISLYAVTISVFFSHARPQVQSEQTIMMIANVFISFLGLLLILASLPLSRQSIETYNNLMHRCDYSEQTHRIYEYSQVLQNIRSLPECASRYSIEECPGYEDAKPYTDVLKNMENSLHCSGFCYRPPTAAAIPTGESNKDASKHLVEGYLPNLTIPNKSAIPNKTAAGNTSGLLLLRSSRHTDRTTPLALLATDTKTFATDKKTAATDTMTVGESGEKAFNVKNLKFVQQPMVTYPATLFSDKNYKTTCEGAVARHMKNFAGDIGFQTFYQGIFLFFIAIATSLLRMIGFCVRKERDQSHVGEAKPGRF